MSNYNVNNIYSAIGKLPLRSGDVVFVHSNIGFFGKPPIHNTDELCETFLKAIFSAIGDEGTVVVPTFTYSYCNGEVFDHTLSASKMGVFAEWVRNHPDSLRSIDPIMSVAAIGRRAFEMVVGVRANSYDRGSFFHRFAMAGGKILNMNLNSGSTFVHYIERLVRVPYRFDKEFFGTSIIGGMRFDNQSQTIFVRKLEDRYIPNFTALDYVARKHGLFKVAKLGRGEMGVISSEDCKNIVFDTMNKFPLFLTNGGFEEVLLSRS